MAHAPVYRFEQYPEPGALLQRYLRRELGIHAHLDAQAHGGRGIDAYHVCTWFQALAGVDQPFDAAGSDPLSAPKFYADWPVHRDQKFAVFVGIGETDELRDGGRNRRVRPIRSRVWLKWRKTEQATAANSRQFSAGDVSEEVFSVGRVSRKCDPGFPLATDGIVTSGPVELPGEMVQRRPVIVEGVSEYEAPIGISGLEFGDGIEDRVLLAFEFLPETNGGLGAETGPSSNALTQFDFEACSPSHFRPTARQVEVAAHGA